MGTSVTAKTAGYERGMKRASKATDKFGRAITRSHTTMGLMVDRLKLIAGTAVAFGGAMIIGRAIMGVEQLNQAMQNSLAIMDNVSKAMRQKMTTAAIEMAKVTVFSATEMAQAYFYLASAGLDAKQAMAALPAVARFAQAGMFDLSRGTDLLTDAQVAYGLASEDAAENLENLTRLGDVLVKANTLAQARVEQFAEALATKAAAKLALFNVPLEEGVAVLAAFALAGVKGAQAGTALSIVVRDMTTKYSKQKQLFKDFNIQMYDQETGALRLIGAIKDIARALSTLDPELRKETLLMMGFTDKSMAFLQVQLQVADQLDAMNEALIEAGETMEQVSRDQMTPFMKGWEKFTATMADVFRALQPAIDEFGRTMEDAADDAARVLKDTREFLDLQDKPVLTPEDAILAQQKRLEEYTRFLEMKLRTTTDPYDAVAVAQLQISEERVVKQQAKVDALTESYERNKAAQEAAAAAQKEVERGIEDELAAKKRAENAERVAAAYKEIRHSADKWFDRTRTQREQYDAMVEQIIRLEALGGFMGMGGDMFQRALDFAAATFDLAGVKRAEDEWASLERAAERYYRSTTTEAEKLAKTMEEIQTLAGAGLLDDDRVKRSMADATADFEKAMEAMRRAAAKEVARDMPTRGLISGTQVGGMAGARVLSAASTAQAKELTELRLIKEAVQELVREQRGGGMQN